jgi:hypothetical protein
MQRYYEDEKEERRRIFKKGWEKGASRKLHYGLMGSSFTLPCSSRVL